MKFKTPLVMTALLLGSGLLLAAQNTGTTTTTTPKEPPPVLPPGFPALPDAGSLKRPDPTPEQIAAAEKVREAQAAAARERWEKEFAPWLHEVPPRPPEPVPFDKEKAMKAHAEERQKEEAEVKEKAARLKLPLVLNDEKGRRLRLRFSGDIPVYYGNDNLGAARTVRADQLWQANVFNLHGSNVVVGVFEEGQLRTTHNVFTGGGFATRAYNFEQGTSDFEAVQHATGVAGTIGGYFPQPLDTSGFPVPNRTNATGMARGARLERFSTPATIQNMRYYFGAQLANFSSGDRTGWIGINSFFNSGPFIGDYPIWEGNMSVSTNESPYFGSYNSLAERMDRMLSTNRVPLVVASAGNNRAPDWMPASQPAPHAIFLGSLPSGITPAAISTNGGFALVTNLVHDANGGTNGYDTLGGSSTAKNPLHVGSCAKNPDLTNAWTVSPFSSFGPTDDGRIKPDLVAPGEAIVTASPTSDDWYQTVDGTSLSAPVVTGGLALVEELVKRLLGTNFYFNGATYKAVAIAGAKSFSNVPGPSYRYGHGVFDAAGSVTFVYAESQNGRNSIIKELRFTQGKTAQFVAKATSSGTVTLTLVWNDPPANNYIFGAMNRTNSMLVNDLDLVVVKGGVTNRAYVLNPFNPSAAATQGDNWRDNVEQVTVTNVTAGEELLVIVTHKGTLTTDAYNNGQWASVVLNGARDETTHPLVLQTMLVSSNQMAVSWPARVGSRFELLANDDLGTTNWTAITGEIVALQTNVSVLLTTTNAQQFLQVRQTR